MNWIQGVTPDERGLLRLSVVSPQGQVFLGRLNAMRTSTPARGNLNLPFEELEMADLKLASTREYLERAGHWQGAAANHLVYEVQLAGMRLLIPSVVLILSFIMHMASIGELLLYGASLDRLCAPRKVGRNAWRIEFGRDLMKQQKDERATQTRFSWLTGFPSARRMWTSVSKYAHHGVLGVDLPAARVDGAVLGRRIGNVVLVTRFHVRRLVPLERPLPTYSHLEGRVFVFNKRHLPAVVGRLEAEVPMPASTPRTHLQPELTDAEWEELARVLLAGGNKAAESIRRKLQETLHVLATHSNWPSQATKDWYRRLVRIGDWDDIEAALVRLRSTHGHSSPSSSPAHPPAEADVGPTPAAGRTAARTRSRRPAAQLTAPR